MLEIPWRIHTEHLYSLVSPCLCCMPSDLSSKRQSVDLIKPHQKSKIAKLLGPWQSFVTGVSSNKPVVTV